MSDHAAFLRAILAEPDKDLPRLIYADWLDERGEGERAALIRVQCELASLPRDPKELHLWFIGPGGYNPKPGGFCRCRECVLLGRERELLLKNWREWVMYQQPGRSFELILSPRWAYSGTPACSFRRGFVSEVACTWAFWLDHHAAILDACPIANARDGLVRLTTWPEVGYQDGHARLWFDGKLVNSLKQYEDQRRYNAGAVLDCLAVATPGVPFELPATPESMAYPTPRGAVAAYSPGDSISIRTNSPRPNS